MLKMEAITNASLRTQKHFLWTVVGPDSSYSPFEIHICWNVLNDDKIEPPIQTEYFDFHCRRRQCSQLFRHAFANAGEHGCTSRQHDVAIQIFTDVHITFHD